MRLLFKSLSHISGVSDVGLTIAFKGFFRKYLINSITVLTMHEVITINIKYPKWNIENERNEGRGSLLPNLNNVNFVKDTTPGLANMSC